MRKIDKDSEIVNSERKPFTWDLDVDRDKEDEKLYILMDAKYVRINGKRNIICNTNIWADCLGCH